MKMPKMKTERQIFRIMLWRRWFEKVGVSKGPDPSSKKVIYKTLPVT